MRGREQVVEQFQTTTFTRGGGAHTFKAQKWVEGFRATLAGAAGTRPGDSVVEFKEKDFLLRCGGGVEKSAFKGGGMSYFREELMGSAVCTVEGTMRVESDYGGVPRWGGEGGAEEDFDVALTRSHLQRVQRLYAHWTHLVSGYQFVTSWSNPLLSLLIFSTLCLTFDLEKILAVPFLTLAAFMTYKLHLRVSGTFGSSFLNLELSKISKARAAYEGVYRPIGQLKIAVSRGKNVRSRDLGLPGKGYATVCYAPKGWKGGEESVYEVRRARAERSEVWLWRVAKESWLKTTGSELPVRNDRL